MAHSHGRTKDTCDHFLKYCAHCDVVYCTGCGKEWKNYPYQQWYWQWPYRCQYPYCPYWGYGYGSADVIYTSSGGGSTSLGVANTLGSTSAINYSLYPTA